MTPLDTEVRFIKGVGETRAKSFKKLGVSTLRDLIMDFPRAYEDRREVKKISELVFGDAACVCATVASPPRLSHIRKGLDITKVQVVDDASRMTITFFNQSYIKNALIPGESYIFFGRVVGKIGSPEMTNPIFEKEASEPAATRRIFPIYRLTSGLSQNIIGRTVRQGLSECGDSFPDQLPKSVCREFKLCQAAFAYENIHFPGSFEELEIARRRLIFEELFLLSCALSLLRSRQSEKSGYKILCADLGEFTSQLSYELTGAQRRAIDDILKDMAGERPMSRLIQGDVGSGKTAVAAAACWAACKAGYQSAFMAPTEILAEQHYKTLSTLLEPLGMNVVLLTGALTAKARREALQKISSGEADLAIGTHALISDAVQFSRLALIVADEQHRFGVQQRAALTAKGESPHVLVMSATPIPRTLALIVYGDLDVSVIDELPPGRQQIDTFLVGENMRQRIYAFIRKLVSEGRQVFIVCPAVEETEENPDGLKSVKEYAWTLSEKVFPELKVALVHGKMRPKEKNEAMSAFAAGETDILVATTVIEVGVDVPNAALMVVENADRFGLSQLHQLRGRVGRGKFKSYCVLFEGAGGETARERLKAMCRTNDGFKIAEEDLRLRGPGDFFGSRQSGLPDMRISSFASDMDILRWAQEAAQRVMADDPELKSPENSGLKEGVRLLIERSAGTLN
ncbi:MAG: ATP-dependent DNA helicase RecG [Oscillospiraceae bacterium]